LDVRQGDVDDGRVEHDHELCRRDDGEGQAQPARRGSRRRGGAGRRRGTDLPGRVARVWGGGGHDYLPFIQGVLNQGRDEAAAARVTHRTSVVLKIYLVRTDRGSRSPFPVTCFLPRAGSPSSVVTTRRPPSHRL